MKVRVEIFGMGTNRGPGAPVCTIDDASEVGASVYANEAGEAYWTLPYNHPAVGLIKPKEQHYIISRWNYALDVWQEKYRGLVDDWDATKDDSIFYGVDYLGLFDTSVTASNTSYTGADVGDILTSEVSAAINQDADRAHSRLGFVSLGHIDVGAQTATLISAYQSRLQFMRQAVSVLQQGTSTRPIFWVSDSSPHTFEFSANQGVDRPNISLEWGGVVSDFRLVGGFGDIATQLLAIGQKRSGATVLYSKQTSLPAATYGIIQQPRLFMDVTDQAALDNLTKSAAKEAAQLNRNLALVIRSGKLAPLDGYGLGDSLPVTIQRGAVNLDHALYTLWGLEWIGHRNGSETLRLGLAPKLT